MWACEDLQLCSDECTNKNITDQIIKGLIYGETVENLKQNVLLLATTITTCQGLELAKTMFGDTEETAQRHWWLLQIKHYAEAADPELTLMAGSSSLPTTPKRVTHVRKSDTLPKSAGEG